MVSIGVYTHLIAYFHDRGYEATLAASVSGLVGAMQVVGRIIQAGNLLGEPLWRPPAPKGFSDENAAWLDGLAQRLDMANAFAHREGLALEPKAIMETALGPLASAETRQTIARAESRPEALTLLLMAPEFQRR